MSIKHKGPKATEEFTYNVTSHDFNTSLFTLEVLCFIILLLGYHISIV